MRVLHFYKTAFPDTMGGVEQAINQIARGARKRGVEVDVLSLTRQTGAGTMVIDGYRAHRARLDFEIQSTGFSSSAVLQFARLARKADVIHYHFPWPFMDVVHFLTRTHKPALVTYHSDIIRQQTLLRLYTPLKRKFLESMDHIVATSPNYLSTSDVLKRYLEKVSVIPIGLDKSTYPEATPERIDSWRARFGSRFFLFVGVIRYYKGLHILIEAARKTDYPVVIVGAGPIEAELRAQAERLGATNVHFLGYVQTEDKVALLRACLGIVFPSHLRSEAFGISLLEGAMYGKPMISSEIGTGTTYINIDGETGLVVPPGDAGALRDAMHALWRQPALAERLGRQAEARYRKHFTSESMVDDYVHLYETLIRRNRGRLCKRLP